MKADDKEGRAGMEDAATANLNVSGRVFIKLLIVLILLIAKFPNTNMFSNSEQSRRIANIKAEIAGNQQRMNLADIRLHLSIFQ